MSKREVIEGSVPEGKSRFLGGCRFYVELRDDGSSRWMCGCGVFGKWWAPGFYGDQWEIWHRHAVKKLKAERAKVEKQKRIQAARDKVRKRHGGM